MSTFTDTAEDYHMKVPFEFSQKSEGIENLFCILVIWDKVYGYTQI